MGFGQGLGFSFDFSFSFDSLAMKRYHGQVNPYQRKYLIVGLFTTAEGWLIYHHSRRMVAVRPAWCWRSNRAVYILIQRQMAEREREGEGLGKEERVGEGEGAKHTNI